MNKLSSCLLSVALMCGSMAAHATTLDFDWSLTDGAETLSGLITGLTDNATSTPTHVYINSAGPTALPEPLPYDLALYADVSDDTFTVTNGAITGFDYQSIGSNPNFDFYTGFNHFALVEIDLLSVPGGQDFHTADPLSDVGFTSSQVVPEPPAIAILAVSIGSLLWLRRATGAR